VSESCCAAAAIVSMQYSSFSRLVVAGKVLQLTAYSLNARVRVCVCACVLRSARCVAVAASVLPLDGHDQWPTISKGSPTPRKFIIHNVPITARPLEINTTDRRTGKPTTAMTTSVCLSNVDNRTGLCHPFGVTGGAIRLGDFKLLVTNPGRAPWESSSPEGTGTYLLTC
jgi:hypothetical protein